ncbi:tRNA (adenosine(37)-N6)-dimethylallyltransferase MiaA [Paludibacter sp.]|uniref:tRNA (adenosine(37)-N6)-dimethylallyltransferase MiaA n=1 Tax=Paludibacter sp. TaxID=1898105 RepID=UPI001353962F|nr:tRNA (adenosine(37)-N6)-dimethylallyltransferase MiaA [Paludibacter sp.]MTK52122.1 tRNA (adenosine(37)-N6)-dimethylallyltransferase MiaA [Paludibacter sp.]
MSAYNLITILGPTATGKTTVATHLARAIDGEIISADSRQIYRGMDLGTGKDLSEYIIDGQPVPYHLIDIVDAGYKYNVFEYQRDFLQAFADINNRNKIPVLCGGTGLYIEAILKGYRLIQVPDNLEFRKQFEGKTLEELTQILSAYKSLHNTTDVDTVKRAIRAIEIAEYYQHHPEIKTDYPDICPLIVGLDISRDERRARITSRLKTRLEEGMVDEVRRLLDSGIAPDDLIYYGLEYKYLTLYVTGRLTFEEMFSQLEMEIHRFAKRQMTWFRGMERRGLSIHWIDASLPLSDKIQAIRNLW